MLGSFNAPSATAIVSASAIMTAAFVGGLAVILSGAPEVKAEPQIKIAVDHVHAKADRLPVAVKGPACSSLGWPHYEQACQFDMRRSVDDVRIVRVLALR